MTKYKFNSKSWYFYVALIAAVLCLAIIGICLFNAFSTQNPKDIFTSIFLIIVHLFVLYTVVMFMFFSGYTLYKDKIIIKTSIFKDKIKYSDISKILFFVSENELYVLKKDDTHIKINIEQNDYQNFIKQVRLFNSDILYEVSFKLDTPEKQ